MFEAIEENKTYQITNYGCNDETADTFEFTETEYNFLKRVFDELNLNSTYTSQPVIKIEEFKYKEYE